MDYSQATFHIKGNFVVYAKDTEAKPVGQSKRQSPNRRRQTFKRRPKDLPKLCRWQQKCTRTTCTYIHLPPEFLEGARRPYRLCWAHPKCRASRCPYIHYTVEKDNSPPSQHDDDAPSPPPTTTHQPPPAIRTAPVPSHLPQSFVCTSGRTQPADGDTDDELEDLRHKILRGRS